ncbi:MAG: methionine aminotransferase [Bacteroidota bacterium]
MHFPSIHSKLPQVGTTIFTVMSQLAVQHKAVNLGQGFPDFPMQEALTNLVDKAIRNGYNQYTHMNGYPLLRERLAAKVETLYGTKINPDSDITITPGGTYAIYTSLTTVLQAGDEVIVFEPAYDSYIPTIEINGAKAIRVPLTYPAYSIPWDIVREKINPRTRMIMINSPHNPTGAVLSAADMQELSAIVEDTNILILSDEVYEHLIFDGLQHESVLRYPELLKRSFVCFSFGKTYHCTGWKLGYCISPPELMHEFRKVHQFNCFTCDTPKQVALAEYLNDADAYLALGQMIQTKRDYFRNKMAGISFTCIPSHGSYFECYNYAAISNEPDTEFAKRLTIDYGVATIPVSAFYRDKKDDKVVRFCFAKKETTLDLAIEKLKLL